MKLTHAFAAALLMFAAACGAPPAQPEAQPEAQAAADDRRAPTVTSPAAGARVTSPLVVEGLAYGDWYFEAQFPLQLVGADGAMIAEAPGVALENWMTEAQVPFRGELRFNVTQDTPATLVLQEDMPADNTAPREIRVPVVLTPAR